MDAKTWDINSLSDPETERSLVSSILHGGRADWEMTVVRGKEDYFWDGNTRIVFAAIQEMDQRNLSIGVEEVRAFLRAEHPESLEAYRQITAAHPVADMGYALDMLIEWHRKRQLHLTFVRGLQDLQDGIMSAAVGNEASKGIDAATLEASDDGLKSFAQLEAYYDTLPPLPKIPTGVPFVDSFLDKGIEAGKFVLLFGDPEAGKTSLGVQILRNISLRHKVLFFPFEFSSREFVERNKKYSHFPNGKPRFDKNNFLVNDTANNLVDLEIQIKKFALDGGRVILIDSQTKVENTKNSGTSEERETEKFSVLQTLAIRYDLSIFFICQQGKEDARSNIITPMKSKIGAHLAHIIIYIEKPKDAEKGERIIYFKKNKQTGRDGESKPVKIDPKTLEFSGRHYDKDDPKSTKTVGSGRPKKAKEPIEFVYEDKEGNVFDQMTLPEI